MRRLVPTFLLALAAFVAAPPLQAQLATPESVFQGVGFVTGAPLTTQPPLAYPIEAQRRGRAGRVVVAFLVGVDGVPERHRIVEADPPLIFDDAVNAAAPGFRFSPAVHNGKPARYETHIVLNFKPQADVGAK